MDIKHLEVFIKIYEENSVTKASEKLFITEPACSLYLKQLENYYQTKFFNRYKKRLIKTNEGTLFYQKAKKILNDFKGLNEIKKDEVIKIASSISIATSILPKVITDFTKYHLIVKTTKDVIIEVLNNNASLGFIEGNLINNNLNSELLYLDELILLCHHEYLNKEEINLNEINNYNFILRDEGSGTRDYFISLLKTKDVMINPIIDSISYEVMIEYAKLKKGIIVIPSSLLNILEITSLKQIKIKDLNLERKTYYIYKKETSLNEDLLNLINEIKRQKAH